METYTNQSTAQRSETSWTGASMAVKTISMRTRAALGTLAEATLAAVEVNLNIMEVTRDEVMVGLADEVMLIRYLQQIYRDYRK